MGDLPKILGFLAMLAAVALLLLLYGPIAQLADYHRFADTRTLLGLGNFSDTASNVPFLLIGVAGIAWWLVQPARERSLAWLSVFAGAIGCCFGSWAYHQNPNDATLVWDRLPIALTFMAFFVAILEDHYGRDVTPKLILPALILGAAGVFYWRATSDLRLYLWTQIVPLLAVPMALLLFPARHTHRGWYGAILACYALAKLTEIWDFQIFAATGRSISGHTLKHLLAAAGLACMFWMLAQRRARAPRGVVAARDRSGGYV
jgi:hypothetical protein